MMLCGPLLLLFTLVDCLPKVAVPLTVAPTAPGVRGNAVWLVGETVKLSCVASSSANLSWYRLNDAGYHLNVTGYPLKVSSGSTLLINPCALQDTGEYTCCSIGFLCSPLFNLTVVEVLSALWVSATPRDLVLLEGGGGVTLNCSATSLPPSVSWTWSRQEEGQVGVWQDVAAARTLTLAASGDSGQYRCSATSDTLGRQQKQSSPGHTVNIVYVPLTDGGYAEVTASALTGVSWVLLALVLLWLWRRGVFHHLASKDPPVKENPGLEKKENQSSSKDEDVYMNYEPKSKFYTNLDPNNRSGSNFYDDLS